MGRLLDAALQCFAERGYHGTTTRDIALRAAMSPAAIYMHYESKAELLYLIVRASHERILDELRVASEAAPTSIERIRALARTHAAYHARWYTAALVANHELGAVDRKHFPEILKMREEIEKLIIDAISAGVASGAFSVPDVRMTAFALLSLGVGVSRWFKPTGGLSPEAVGDLYADLAANLLGAANGAASSTRSAKGAARSRPRAPARSKTRPRAPRVSQ